MSTQAHCVEYFSGAFREAALELICFSVAVEQTRKIRTPEQVNALTRGITHEQVRAVYQPGDTRVVIATKLNCSLTQAGDLLQATGLVKKTPMSEILATREADLNRVRPLYHAGEDVKVIADTLGMTEGRVKYLCSTMPAGERRPKGVQLQRWDREHARELGRQGRTLHAIAEAVGASYDMVRKTFKAHSWEHGAGR